jgi:mannan endo-1,4-beta-mannosidase
MKPIYFIIFSLLILSCNNVYKTENQEVSFVMTKDGHFIQGDSAFYFVGTNYWYGPSLGLMDDTVRGLQRLRQELDFLKSQGITNLRICAAVEGEGTIQGVPRIVPVFQQSPGVFVTDNLKGLDRLLEEMSRKEMKAVLFFSNNWEWSGGFLQYLYWNKAIDSTAFYNRLSWEKLRDVVSGFYSCEPCIQQYEAQVKAILTRKNSINGLKYIDDPTIFAWQLANEPRPMRPAAIDAYKNWIARTAKMIKSIDTNHLVTIGVEGFIGTENMDVEVP